MTAFVSKCHVRVVKACECRRLEEAGLTVKRYATRKEAFAKAYQLLKTGQLRAVVFGCGELEASVLSSRRSRSSGYRLDLSSRSVGSFLGSKVKAKEEEAVLVLLNELQKQSSEHARTHGPIPIDRVAIYSTHRGLNETAQLQAWKAGIAVIDHKEELEKWIDDRYSGAGSKNVYSIIPHEVAQPDCV